MRRRVRRERAEIQDPDVNLTPLIDVVFVILVIFMLLAPLLKRDLVDLAEGGGEPLGRVEGKPIFISVLADETLCLGGKKISHEALKRQLAMLHRQNPEAHALLFHDEAASFGTYQKVKKTVQEAGFSELEVLLKSS